MAKRETGVAGAADVAAVAASAGAPTAPGNSPAPVARETVVGKVGAMAPSPEAPLVIKYKPPEPEADDGAAPSSETAAEEAPAAVEGEPAAEEQAAEGEEASTEEPKQEEAPKPPKARAILERIRAEKAKLKAEEVAAQERTQRQQLEQQLSRYTTGNIGARLAAIGITTDEQRMQLAEALLIGKDDVALPAGTAPPSTDQRVAELEKRLAAEEAAKQQAAQQQNYERGLNALVTVTSDMDVGIIKTVEKVVGGRHADGSPAGMHLVFEVARELWNQAGMPKDSQPMMREAAKRVAEHYAKTYPELGAKQPAAPAPGAKRPAMGQRVAPKPGTNGRKLPLDREDRDDAIKREFGW